MWATATYSTLSPGRWILPTGALHGMAQRKVKTLEAIFFENAEHKNNFEFEMVRRKNSIIWNQKDSDSIHIDNNHAK